MYNNNKVIKFTYACMHVSIDIIMINQVNIIITLIAILFSVEPLVKYIKLINKK